MASSDLDPQLSGSNTPTDPLGILKVSGFYGPGTWSGWFFTILTAYIAIIRHPESKHVHDILLHLLGTNWAAVDLMRQVSLYKQLDRAGNSETELKELHGPIAAGLIITSWGTVAAVLQFALIFALLAGPYKKEDPNVDKPLPTRAYSLLLGALIPSIALSYFLLFNVKTGDGFFGITQDLPAFYWKGIIDNTHIAAIDGACAIGLLTGIFIVIMGIGDLAMRWGNNHVRTLEERHKWLTFSVSGALFIAIPTAFVISGVASIKALVWYVAGVVILSVVMRIWSGDQEILLALFSSFLVGPYVLILVILVPTFIATILGSYFFHFVLSGGKSWNDTCFFMPCAPQKISDWDQAFSLMAGLAMFVAEGWPYFGMGLKWGRKMWARRRSRGNATGLLGGTGT